MTKLLSSLPCVLLFFGISFAVPAAKAGITDEQIASSISRRICFESYWWDRRGFRLGDAVSFDIRKNDDIAYALSYDAQVPPGVTRWMTFFSVYNNGFQASVGESYGFNLDTTQGSQALLNKIKEVHGGPVESARIVLPADCTPTFPKLTPDHVLVIDAIARSIAKEVALLNAHGRVSHRRMEQIVVADFMNDYPETLVYIPRTSELFHVALSNAEDPLSDSLRNGSDFAILPESRATAIAASKQHVLRFGIYRRIVIPAS